MASQTGPCFTIHTIQLRGVSVLSERVQQGITTPYQGRCLALTQINALIHDVSNAYIERGFITSRAFIQPQDLASGHLAIDVLEGKLEKIELNHQQPFMLNMVFPGMQGKILNLRAIEQGMEQLNRLPAYQVQIEILPGSQPGYSIVQLTREPRLPFSISAGVDNSGQRSTGETQLNGLVTLDSPLGLAEQWYLSGSSSSDYATSHDAHSLMAGVSLPWGYWNFSYDYSWNDYRNYFYNRDFQWRSTGSTVTQRVGLQRVVFRNGEIKTALTANVTHRDGENQLNETRLDSSSRALSNVTLGINHSQKLWGGLATLNPAWTRGTPWLGGEADTGKNAAAPKAEFTRWSLAASYYHPVTERISYLTSLYGQTSPDQLYGSDQMTIGGESSVRGFKEQYLSGNRGGYWRNQLDWQAFEMPLLGNIGFSLALDGGWIAHNRQQPGSNGTLWGTSAGISSANRWFSSQLTVGTPLTAPDNMSPDALVVYYRASVAF